MISYQAIIVFLVACIVVMMFIAIVDDTITF